MSEIQGAKSDGNAPAAGGRIDSAFGQLTLDDSTRARGWKGRAALMLAMLGPGLIVMFGDNDAGAYGVYAQAGQQYGTALLWLLALMVPVLYVNLEMALRLGAVTGVGHARLILARFGRFWAAFSIFDLLLLNALTIVTEFFGISLALDFLGASKPVGIGLAALLLAAAASGDFRRFERFAFTLIVGSLLLIPVLVAVHPSLGQVAHDLFAPALPEVFKFQDVMLLMVAIIGAAIAPWQLFFQQSYVIDKGVSASVLRYARADLWIGIVLALLVAAMIMIIAAATFAGRPEFGHFIDTGAVTNAIGHYVGPTIGALFALALIDACMIGAAAVTLSTAYALGDILAQRHSLRSKPAEAKVFYLVYFGLIALAASVVLIPQAPIGLFINAVQALAGVLLPSSTVFLLLLCNDPAVIGPWVNSRWRNAVTGVALGAQMLISALMTVSVVFPHAEDQRGVTVVMLVGAIIGLILGIPLFLLPRPRAVEAAAVADAEFCARWRMPALETLVPAPMPLASRNWLATLRLYLFFAAGLVALRLVRQVIAGE